MRILVISNACFKTESACGYCVENILLALSMNEHIKIDVISFGEYDETFRVKNNLNVIYRKNSIFKKNNFVQNNIQLILNKLTSELLDPDTNIMYQNKVLKSVDKLMDIDTYDAVISVMGGKSTEYAAYKIRNKYKVKWISILFDPFVENNHLYKKNKIYYKKAKKFDQIIKDKCDLILLEECIYNNLNKKNISAKIAKIGMPLILPNIKSRKINYVNENKIIRIAFFGVLYKNLRNPEYSIKLLLSINNTRIDFYGNLNTKEILSNYKYERISYRGRVSHRDIEKIVHDYDYLLNIGNNTLSQVPSKIYEYINYRKPIINIVKNSDDPTIEIINKYKFGINLIENDNNNIQKLNDFFSNGLNIPDEQEIIEKFQINNPYYSAKIILKELNEGNHDNEQK